VSLFDENIKFYFTVEKNANFRPGIGSGSAFVLKPGSRSAYNECGSRKLLRCVRTGKTNIKH
jgi:hypothetical protein